MVCLSVVLQKLTVLPACTVEDVYWALGNNRATTMVRDRGRRAAMDMK